jgi:hypothetical protein
MAVTHRSLSVAVESTFGSPDSDGIPSVSGLTFVSIPCERDPVVLSGDPVASERNDTRDGAYFNAPEPDTVWSGGSRVRRRTGSIVCRLDLTSIGTSANNYNSNYLGYLLGAGFNTQAPSSNLKADTASAVTDENTYTPTNAPATTDVGLLIGSLINGRAEYSAITDNDVGAGSDVTVSPAFSSGFTGTPTIRGLQTWYVPSRTSSGQFNHSVAFKIDGQNFQQLAFGCVLESMNITLDNGRLMAELTYQAAFITDNHSGAIGSVEPVYNSGSPAFFRGSYVVVSDGSPASSSNGTVGETQGRIALDCEDFSLTVTNTLTPLAYSNDVIAMSGMEVSDVSVELSLTLSTVNSTVANDYFNRTVRQVLVGTGPIADGKGCAIMLPAAILTNDPSVYDVSGNDIVRQTLNYQQARYAGDFTTSSYEANAGNSPFRLGLVVGNV